MVAEFSWKMMKIGFRLANEAPLRMGESWKQVSHIVEKISFIFQ